MAIIQYARKNEVVFIGQGLLAGSGETRHLSFLYGATSASATATNVTNYVQKANRLFVTSNTDAQKFQTGVGIVNTTSGAFGRFITSSNNRVYLDENYINLKIDNNSTNPLPTTSEYKDGTVVCQTTVRKIVTNPTDFTASFYGAYDGTQTKTTSLQSGFKTEYGKGLLGTYGVYANGGTVTWQVRDVDTHITGNDVEYHHYSATLTPSPFSQSYRVLFPKTGWYQFTYQADQYFTLWLDDLSVARTSANIAYNKCNNTGETGYKTEYRWVSAGAHSIKYEMEDATAGFDYYATDGDPTYVYHNQTNNQHSAALIIRGPSVGMGIAVTPTNSTFYYGYWGGNAWIPGPFGTIAAQSGMGSNVLDDPTNGIVVFQTRREPGAFSEYVVCPSFVGRIQYYDPTLKVVSIRPETGELKINDSRGELSVLRVMSGGVAQVLPLANVVSYNTVDRFPAGSTIKEVVTSTGAFTLSSTNVATVASVSETGGTPYEHNSGRLVSYNRITNDNATQSFKISANISSSMINEMFRYSDALGDWRASKIKNIVGNNTIVISDTVPDLFQVTAESSYSVGNCSIDLDGVVCGLWNVPEGPLLKIAAGSNYEFTVSNNVDVKLATSYASKTYATGTLSEDRITIGDKVTSTQIISNASEVAELRRTWDIRTFAPLAQTFFVPGEIIAMDGEKYSPYGAWISSIDLWFAKKPPQTPIPVVVRIVSVENNQPTSKVLGEATVQWQNVNAYANPFVVAGAADVDLAKLTKFRFSDPVYLPPDQKYAITVSCNDSDYRVYVAARGVNNIGTTGSSYVVSTEPYVEQFYTSQNGSTWQAVNNTDLMFRINKCQFKSGVTSSAIFVPDRVGGKTDSANVAMDGIILRTVDLNQQPTSTDYILTANNETGTDVLTPLNINPGLYVNFGADLNISTKTSTRRRKYATGDFNSTKVEVQLTSTHPDTTPILSKENLSIRTFENLINDAGIYTGDIVVTNAGRHANASNIVVTISDPDDPNGTIPYVKPLLSTGISNTDIVIVSNGAHQNAKNITVTFSDPYSDYPTSMGGQKANAYCIGLPYSSANIIVDIAGSGYFNKAPTITFSEPGVAAGSVSTAKVLSNVESILVVDEGSGYYKKANITLSEVGSTSNATATIYGETDVSGGNHIAKYITKRVDLAEGFEAGDLRVFIDCIRPQGTNINAYYKVKSPYDGDSISNKRWQFMDKVVDTYSPDKRTVVQLEFRPTVDVNTKHIKYIETENGTDVEYPIGGVFNQFIIKLTMTAANPTVIPMVTNFSAMAVPGG